MFSYINAGKHSIKPACTNGLPDDESMMFETFSRHEELN
jgi:hypothetical protein